MAELRSIEMSSDFFIAKELPKRTGLTPAHWRTAILKELIDNALDAIEANTDKQILIQYIGNTLCIFDNGGGLTFDNVKSIYDFDKYMSNRRHIITASRGKQGNGLKTIIGMCFVNNYNLLWHTSDGIVVMPIIGPSTICEQIIVDFKTCRKATNNGIEINGFDADARLIDLVCCQYAQCNPDVNFSVQINDNQISYDATTEAVNKIGATSLSFYSHQDFVSLIKSHNPSETYKSVLDKHFGTRIRNSSQIKSKIEDLDFTKDVPQDFEMLRNKLNTKPFTLLQNHLLGFGNELKVFMKFEDMLFPCMVEYNFSRLNQKREETRINCYINNSITYADAGSITFKYGRYKISNTKKEVFCNDLLGLLEDFKEYDFNFHFITPYPKFIDYGKTKLNISDFILELVDSLRKSLSNEKRKFDIASPKRVTKKSIAEKYMTDAFMLASTNGKYSITARQMYYKLRELSVREDTGWEGRSTYSDFTQNWLTVWLDENEEYESKVNFSERGNFYVDGSQTGLGTASVRTFIDAKNNKTDKFKVYGGTQDLYIDDTQFNIRYKYDKALYIEKTGFDSVFRAERLAEKYNLLIVSGQGFASRAARRLLYDLQQQGLKLYCMHDLDVDGVSIFNSMQQANDKFKHDLDIEDLGITLADIIKYNIAPERIDKTEKRKTRLEGIQDKNLRSFFDKGKKVQRVELNAFSTEQILEMIDNKLGDCASLPKVNLSQSLEFDGDAIRDTAFIQIMKNKYRTLLNGINLEIDLESYDGELTLFEAKEQIPLIKEKLLQAYEKELLKQLAI